MAESTIWWLLAGGAIAIELATGTFYLLMISVGLIAGAIAAHLGLPLTGQIITAATVAVKAIMPTTFVKPPTSIMTPRIDASGLTGLEIPASDSIWTPIVPTKTETNTVNHGEMVKKIHAVRSDFKSRAQ